MNKGEWSETYAFLKILAEGNLYLGDAQLQRTKNFYPVISVIRETISRTQSFLVDNSNIIIRDRKHPDIIIPAQRFLQEAQRILPIIKREKGSFSIPAADQFLRELGCNVAKASSKKKADITIKIHDFRTNLEPILGFSIKSKLGSASTLFNASPATNFIFNINGRVLTDLECQRINNINSPRKIKDRVISIFNSDSNLVLSGFDSPTFKNNLILIDSWMPQILANALLIYYRNQASKMADICEQLEKINPLKYDLSFKHQFYEHKIKRFLSEVALGMMPDSIWTGQYDSTEGYIIIKEDGDVVCYHIINRNLFENYLLANTKLDTPSSTRHGFAEIFNVNGELKIKLNLQIRFL